MKKRNLFYIILISIVTIACLWAFISAGVITKDFKEKLEADKLGQKEVTISNLLVTETKNGEKEWEMFAEEGFYDGANQLAYLSDIIGNFYKDEKTVASFKSKRGTYNQTTREIILFERSTVVYKDGTNITADEMRWKGNDSDVLASGNVIIELPTRVVVYAEQAILKSGFYDLQVIGKTKTEIYDEVKL